MSHDTWAVRIFSDRLTGVQECVAVCMCVHITTASLPQIYVEVFWMEKNWQLLWYSCY